MRLQRRQTEILEAVKLSGSCSISKLADQLQVSDETIRRNISTGEEGLLIKFMGE